MNIIISDKGKEFLRQLDFNISENIDIILAEVPQAELLGLSFIKILESEEEKKESPIDTVAAYFQSSNNKQAFIEIYLNKYFSKKYSKEILKLILPLKLFELAQIIYHEIGIHFAKTKTHNIKQKKCEEFAVTYSKRIIAQYLSKNKNKLTQTLDLLEKYSKNSGLKNESVVQMKQLFKEVLNI